MPSSARKKKQKTPKGYENIEEKLKEFQRTMREAEADLGENKTNAQTLWPILRLNHQRSRFIYNAFNKNEISREVYDYCLEKKLADASLIAKWKKPGYSTLCCLKCIQTTTNFGTTCICRVPPSSDATEVDFTECTACGCRGCYK
jgi:bud site selection protein 31